MFLQTNKAHRKKRNHMYVRKKKAWKRGCRARKETRVLQQHNKFKSVRYGPSDLSWTTVPSPELRKHTWCSRSPGAIVCTVRITANLRAGSPLAVGLCGPAPAPTANGERARTAGWLSGWAIWMAAPGEHTYTKEEETTIETNAQTDTDNGRANGQGGDGWRTNKYYIL